MEEKEGKSAQYGLTRSATRRGPMSSHVTKAGTPCLDGNDRLTVLPDLSFFSLVNRKVERYRLSEKQVLAWEPQYVSA